MKWLLTQARIPYLFLLLVLTLLLLWPLSRLEIDHSNASMVAQDPQQLQRDEHFRQLFGQDEYLLLSVTTPQLLDPAGLQLIRKLTQQLEAIPQVKSVFSLSNAQQISRGRFGADIQPLISLPPDDPGNRRLIELSLAADPRLAERLISPDHHTAALTIELKYLTDNDPRRQRVVQHLRQLMEDESAAAKFHLTGTLVQKLDVAAYVLRDQQVLVPLSVLVLALCLGCAFRQLSGVLLPLLVMVISLIWTLGFYSLAGLTLNTITSLLPPVIMVLSVTTSIHLYNGWQRRGEEHSDQLSQLVDRVRALRRPCFYTAITTALGLLSLTLSNIPAIHNFGLYAAMGVMFSFAISITLVPVCLSFLDKSRHSRQSLHDGVLGRWLQRAARLSIQRAGTVVGFAVLLSLVCLPGFFMIANNTDLVRFLRSDAPLFQDTMFIDRTLSGVNPLNFMLSRVDGLPLTSANDLQRIALFKQKLRQQAGVGSVSSLVDLISRLHQVETNAVVAEVPKDADQLDYYFDLLQASPDQQLLRQLVTEDFTTLRINARFRALGTAEVDRMVEQALQESADFFSEGYNLQVTGAYYRIARESNDLVRTLQKSFGISMVVVMLAIGLMFRSWRLTLVALVPNLIPLFWTGGLMGFAGIDLSTGTAMIGAVAFGLIVDATIHYLAHYQRILTATSAEAIEQTTTGIGRALTIASLVLVLGFWVGCFGSFKPTIYFSLLVGTTMIGALICDLLVLPACLTLYARRQMGTL